MGHTSLEIIPVMEIEQYQVVDLHFVGMHCRTAGEGEDSSILQVEVIPIWLNFFILDPRVRVGDPTRVRLFRHFIPPH